MLTTKFILFAILIVNTLLVIIIFFKQSQLSQRIQHIHRSMTETNRIMHTQHQQALIDERRTHILMIAFQIREAVSKQIDDLHPRLIESLPIDHSLTSDEIARCFTSSQAIALQSFFRQFEEYINKHWLNDQKQYKIIFKGNKYQINSELAQLHLASKHLVKELDQLLLTIQKK